MLLNPRKRSRRRSHRRRTHKKVLRLNPRRRSRRAGRRSGGGGGGGALSGLKGSVKQAFSKELLMMGAGVFLTGVAYTVLIAKTTKSETKDGKTTYTSSLPLGNDQIGGLLYGVGIPIAVGFLTRKWPAFSRGAYLSSVMTLIKMYIGPSVEAEIKKLAKIDTTAGTSAYIRRGLPLAGVGRLPGPNNHTAINQFGGPGQAPLPRLTNAWAKS